MTRMQKMSDRALELWKENLPLEHILCMMRLEGYSLEEVRIVERWVKQRKHGKETNTIKLKPITTPPPNNP